MQHINHKVALISDFNIGQLVESLSIANETLINDAIKRVSESVNAYKEAVEVDLLGTLDDEAIEEFKG